MILIGVGYAQVMVFTQYTDTMDFPRWEIGRDPTLCIMTFRALFIKAMGATTSEHQGGVNSGPKIAENHRFEIRVFFARSGSILLFDPRREHSSVPTAKWHSRCAEGLSRLAASSRPPAGLGLDWPEHSGTLDRIGAGGAHHVIGNFKPVVLSEIHAAGDKGARVQKMDNLRNDARNDEPRPEFIAADAVPPTGF